MSTPPKEAIGVPGFARILPLAFSLILFSPSAFAAAKVVQRPTFEQTVKAITADSITITKGRNAGMKVTHVPDVDGDSAPASTGNVETLKIDSFTRITVDGLPGVAADIKPGMAVQVTLGMDPGVAGSLDAHTLPPAPPKPAGKLAKAAKPKVTGKGKGATAKAAFRKIGSDQVLAISDSRITVGQPGAKAARAYFITAMTTITIDGVAATAADLREGMDVVVSGDATTAEEIAARGDR